MRSGSASARNVNAGTVKTTTPASVLTTTAARVSTANVIKGPHSNANPNPLIVWTIEAISTLPTTNARSPAPTSAGLAGQDSGCCGRQEFGVPHSLTRSTPTPTDSNRATHCVEMGKRMFCGSVSVGRSITRCPTTRW